MKRITPTVRICSEQKSLRVPRKRIHELACFVAKAEKVAIEEVDILVVGGRKMARLHREYLSIAGETDVMSFDLTIPGSKGLAAQLIVCTDVAIKEARKRNLAPQHELLLYVLHGLLHVIGYDDQTPDDRQQMHQRQDQLLADFLKHMRS